ncbi:substrate-binding domain-containing protein [Amycolatopsis suaedae]|uniref:DeoR family transcriptional regulator n=1 Tax=Amycolatopsis suaedae TaxID=2510978 RepID=A0A4Q7J5A3_9PSEU|nr:substrate-binding domain-containing protein [Amycolatopsis suaedae]RZQ61483.1 DeoR family transcriptional regulator [Amycolatopsis suaedae]
MRELGDDRRRRILAAVEARGEARVADLAGELEVSVVTVRRDVEQLAQEGKLRRRHGVVRSLVPVAPARPEHDTEGGAVALVVPERHAYLNEVVHGARSALDEAGMRVVLHIAPKAEGGSERPILERALSDDVRGLLIAPRWRTVESEEADYGWIADVRVPTVVMERRPRPGSVLHATDSVCTDHWYGVHLAVDHLHSLGHKRIVLAARHDSPTARAVRAAFAEITANRPGIEDHAVILSAPDAGPDEKVAPQDPAVLAGLVGERGFTGAVLHGDVDALMLVERLAEAGLQVPRDCSVVAYDDVVAALGSTPLTAIAPPKAEVGRVAAELLIRRLLSAGEQSRRPQRIELMPELKVRGSTRPL